MEGKNKNIIAFDEHLTNRYGKRGTEKRTEFEINAKSFLIGAVIKRHICILLVRK